jgi:hypothetical protein
MIIATGGRQVAGEIRRLAALLQQASSSSDPEAPVTGSTAPSLALRLVGKKLLPLM